MDSTLKCACYSGALGSSMRPNSFVYMVAIVLYASMSPPRIMLPSEYAKRHRWVSMQSDEVHQIAARDLPASQFSGESAAGSERREITASDAAYDNAITLS